MNDDDGPAWGQIAHRGELSLVVLTLGGTVARLPTATPFFVVCQPDDLPHFGMGVGSLELLKTFCCEMAPRSIEVIGMEGDSNVSLLKAMLERAAAGSIH